MRLKAGVRIQGLRPEITIGLAVAESLFREHDVDLIVTSVIEGTHSRGSLHFVGQAADLRSAHLDRDLRQRIRRELDERLGDDFDVVLEQDHFHIEFQPKSPYGT